MFEAIRINTTGVLEYFEGDSANRYNIIHTAMDGLMWDTVSSPYWTMFVDDIGGWKNIPLNPVATVMRVHAHALEARVDEHALLAALHDMGRWSGLAIVGPVVIAGR